MGETRFTPGPWKLVKQDDDFDPFEIRMGTAIKSPHNCRVIHRIPIDWDLKRGDKGYAEGKANLRLIATAPVLYSALDRFAKAWDAGWRGTSDFIPTAEQMNELHDAYDAAHEALALARGESPSPEAA